MGLFDDVLETPKPPQKGGLFDDVLTPEREPTGLLDALAKRLGAGVAGKVGGGLRFLGETLNPQVRGLSPNVQSLADVLLPQRLAGQQLINAGVSAVDTASTLRNEAGGSRPTSVSDAFTAPLNAAKYYGGTIAESVPEILAAIATRNPAAGAAIIGGATGAGEYGSARQQGMSQFDATQQAGINALLETGLGKVPLEAAFGAAPFLRRAVTAAGKEAGTEALTQAGQDILPRAARGDDIDLGQVLANAIDASIVGAATGPIEAIGGRKAEPVAPTPVPLDVPRGTEIAPTPPAPVVAEPTAQAPNGQAENQERPLPETPKAPEGAYVPNEFIAKTKGGTFRLKDVEAPAGTDFSEFGQVREVTAYAGDTEVGKLVYANDGTPPTIEVNPDYRRQGIATAMLKLAKERGGVLGEGAAGISGKGAEYRTPEGQAFRSQADEGTVELSPFVQESAPPVVEAAKAEPARFTTMRLLPRGTTLATPGVLPAMARIAKELGIQGSLGGVEELVPYLAEQAGTEYNPATAQGALETFVGGAVAEGGLGASVQAGKEAIVGVRGRATAQPSASDPWSVVDQTPVTPTGQPPITTNVPAPVVATKEAEAPVAEEAPVTPEPAAKVASPSPRSTSTKNAVSTAERSAEGRDPIIKDAARTNQETVDKALETVRDNPTRGAEVVAKLRNEGTAGVSLDDEAVLMVHKTALRNRRNKAADVLGDPNASEEAKEVARQEWESTEAQIEEIDQATYASGREWGRLGQFRQRMLREDFTLEAMERKLRAVTGRPLSVEETEKLRDMARNIESLQKRAEAAEARVANADSIATYDDLVKRLAESMRGPKKRPTLERLRDAANESRAALAGLESVPSRKGQSGAAINPVAFYHLARIGAYHVANGAATLADWTAKMRADLGAKLDEFRDMLPAAFQAAKMQARLPSDGPSVGSTLDSIDPQNLTNRDVYRLAEAHIRAGLRGEDQVMAAVHASLLPQFEGITERDVRRMFSDYGKATFPSKDAAKVELRQLRSLVQMQESIDRINEGLPALKSGPQRDAATQAIREKRAELNELLKTLTKGAKTPGQLASYNDARIRNLNNQIADITKQIETGERPAPKTRPTPSAEVQRLTEQRDALIEERDSVSAGDRRNEAEKKAMRKQIEGVEAKILGQTKPVKGAEQRADDSEMTKLRDQLKGLREQRDTLAKESAARKSVENRISDLMQRLAGKEKPVKAEGKPDSAAVADLKRIRDELAAQLRDLERPVVDKEARYQELRARDFDKRIKELQERIAAGDVARTPPRVPRELNAANERARFELDKAKEEFLRLQMEAEFAQRSPLGKIFGHGRDVINLARAMMTSFDFSGLLRQGGFISYAHPIRAAKAVPQALKAFGSAQAESVAKVELQNRPNAPLYKRAGLELTGIGSGPLTKVEEAFASRLLDRFPRILGGGLIRGSGRSYTTLLNRLRADSFDAMVASLAKNGQKPTKAEMEAIANFINVATGRGKIGKSESAGEAINSLFFAPRLVASRFQLLAGQPLYGGTARTRKMVAQEYARFLMGVGVVTALAGLAKDDDDDTSLIELDPRSANFGKLRFRDTFLDPLAGLAQVSTFISRIAAGETKNTKGVVKPIRPNWTLTDLRRAAGEKIPAHKLDKEGGLPFGSSDAADVIFRFLRTKLAPVPGAIVNTAAGSDLIGQPTSPVQTLTSLVTPMSFNDVGAVMEEQGVPRGAAIVLMSLLGMGMQHRAEKRPETLDKTPENGSGQ